MPSDTDSNSYIVMPLQSSVDTVGYRGDYDMAIEHAKAQSIVLDMPIGVYLEKDQRYNLVGTAFRGEWSEKVDREP